MSLFLIILFLLLVSIMLAFRSLHTMQKMEEIHDVKNELQKGKVIFHQDSSLASSEESSSDSSL